MFLSVWSSQFASCNMAGQVLRDLVREEETDLTDLFFVNRRLIPLPPEPLRFALAQGGVRALALQDGWERRKQPAQGVG